MDTIRVLNDRSRAMQEDQDRIPPPNVGGSRSLLCVTTTVATYPTAANAFYMCISQGIDGTEAEGATATFNQDTGTPFPACNVGSQIPPEGTEVIVHFVGGKASFEWNG